MRGPAKSSCPLRSHLSEGEKGRSRAIDRPIDPNPNVRPRTKKQGGSRGGQRTRNLRMRRAGGGLRLRRHVGGGYRRASRPQRPHRREGAAVRRHHRAVRRLALDSRHLAGAGLGHRRRARGRRGPICATGRQQFRCRARRCVSVRRSRGRGFLHQQNRGALRHAADLSRLPRRSARRRAGRTLDGDAAVRRP